MKVCSNCFSDSELQQNILANYDEIGVCFFCNENNVPLLSIEEFLDFFTSFIGVFSKQETGIPLIELIQKDWSLFSIKDSNNLLLDKILERIESEIMNSNETVSYINEIDECVRYWDVLKESIKWEKRFLTNIGDLEEYGWDGLFTRQIMFSKEEKMFRARLHFSDQEEFFSEKNMGCPPKEKVMSGRANPEGIPFLYLSKSVETTVYEIRATFLDEITIGEFKVKDFENIYLVDFTEVDSAFKNVDEVVKYAKSMLLKKRISFDLSKPIRRYDSEFDYIPTQFICEYIRNITNADGILFNSSLHLGGKNIVLFNENKVECVSVQKHRIKKVEILSETISTTTNSVF
ncbi:MAG: RES family NAD+ phosphorylase [Bacteroidia bacterium]